MAETQTYYDSVLTGEELDAAMKKLPQVDQAVEQSARNALLAKSWAEGGTDLRADEETHNARYWCSQAQTITQGALGWYADADQLRAAYPQGSNGQWAIVGATDTIWTWDSDTAAWVDTGAQIDLSNYYTKPQAEARFQMPVGYIFDWAPVEGQETDLSTPEKVAAHFGYGIWQEITGRFTFGRDEDHEVGSTGGELEHTLAAAEAPDHTHPLAVGQSGGAASFPAWAFTGATGGPSNGFNANYALTGYTGSKARATEPHNNMPPYLTVYKWQRIA